MHFSFKYVGDRGSAHMGGCSPRANTRVCAGHAYLTTARLGLLNPICENN